MLLEVKALKTGFVIEKRYTEVVRGIDLTIGENEVVGLVGESGCGKTLTAFSIMKLLPQNGVIKGGNIVFNGADLVSLTERQMLKIRGQSISIVFQEPFTALNPVITAGEQIREALSAHNNISRKEGKSFCLGLLEKVRIDNPKRIYSSYPHQLSGGEAQRVLIAAALALNPELLIADEPTTALDVTTQSGILKLLLELKTSAKMSILFITHDFGIINEVASRVYVMKDGRIVEEGPKKDILSMPRQEYTRKLLEAIPRIKDAEKKMGIGFETDLIEIKNLSKSFSIERGFFRKERGKKEALKNVNLTIKKGQTLGLVGESGCGKTTLGKMLIGLIEPDEGQIIIEGKDLKEHLKDTSRQIRQMMQIVFQDPYGSLDPRMNMADIVLEGPAILGKGKPEKENILKDVLEKVRLDFQDRFKYPHQFSGGERQRIAIARALAVKPEFLVLDEPVSSLDVLIQSQILKLLRSLQRTLGLTYLFISHDLRVVENMSDEVAVMYYGSIVEIASSRDIYKNPQHPYTQILLKSIPTLA